MDRYGIAIERLRRLEPNSRLSESLIAPNAVPDEEFVQQMEWQADAAFVRSQSPLLPPPGGTPSLGHIGLGGLFTFVGPDGSQDVFGNRNIPGVATTTAALPEVRGQWLTPNMPYGAPVPAQVASLLVGRRFQDFDALREAFWEAVAKVPELAAQFPHDDFVRMQDGSAPTAPTPGWAGKRAVYELHHHIPIRLGGAIYNLNNILVISPRSHIDIHR